MSQSQKSQFFEPLRQARSSQRVAEVIWRTIASGQYAPGEVLPPERTLAERFQVTRNTVREALRSLEQSRLVSIRQGSGVTVRDYLATAGVELLGELLVVDALDHELMAEVLEARAVLGRAMLGRAVARFDLARTAELRAAVDEFTAEAEREQPTARRVQDLEFDVHGALLRGAGNRAFVLLHNSLRRIYEPVAHLFERVVANPAALAASYRAGLAALERGDRQAASAAFCVGFDAVPVLPDEARRGRP